MGQPAYKETHSGGDDQMSQDILNAIAALDQKFDLRFKGLEDKLDYRLQGLEEKLRDGFAHQDEKMRLAHGCLSEKLDDLEDKVTDLGGEVSTLPDESRVKVLFADSILPLSTKIDALPTKADVSGLISADRQDHNRFALSQWIIVLSVVGTFALVLVDFFKR